MKTLVLFVVAFLACACATHAGPILGGASAALLALDQMLAAGTITPEQYVALHNGFDSSMKAIDGVRGAVDAVKSAQWSTGEIAGTGLSVLGAALAAAMRAKAVAEKGAVEKVMQLRGPTEAQRKMAKGAS